MSRFSTKDLPRPVVVQELSGPQLTADRIADFKERMAARGLVWDVDDLETDPIEIACESAGAGGDLFFTAMTNDVARAVLLESFAEDTDLDLHAARVGLQRLEGEQDPQLRERIRLAKKGKSAAGPDDYYISAARNFDPLVRDVAVAAETRDFSDRVLILSVLTSDNGGLITAELQAGLTEALNDPSFRSRNVTVEIVPAIITTKNVSAHVYLYPETPESVVDQAEQALVDAMAADQRLGFDLTRSYVDKHLQRDGIQRVELQGWSNAFAGFNEAIRLGTITLTMFRQTS